MNIQNLPCTVCAHTRDQKVWELQLEPEGKTNILNNIYVGQIENIASNIQAAFIRLGKDLNGYLPLGQAEPYQWSESCSSQTGRRDTGTGKS